MDRPSLDRKPATARNADLRSTLCFTSSYTAAGRLRKPGVWSPSPPKLRTTVLESRPGMRFDKAEPLAVSGGALCAVWILAGLARPLLDAAWFGMDRAGFLGRTAVLWLSMAVVSLSLYVAWRVARVLIPSIGDRPLGSSLSRVLLFLALLYPALAAHFLILTVTAGDAPTAWHQGISWLAPFHAYNIGLAAFWSSAGWMAACGTAIVVKRLREGILVSAAALRYPQKVCK